MKYKGLFGIGLFLFLFTSQVSATIKINEIYPAPETGEKEWVEIFNTDNNEVDLKNYVLTDMAGNKISFESPSVASNSYALALSQNVLNNSGDTVFLKNNLGEIIEIATYSGTFTAEKTYVKCPDGTGSWYILTTATKNISNETACLCLTPTITTVPTPTSTIAPIFSPTPTEEPTFEPTATPYSTPGVTDNIYISEVMVNPQSGQKEWVEIYNDNDFPVFLDAWYIDDIEAAGSSPKKFSLNIPAREYVSYDLSSSMFNNGSDQVRLLDFNKNLKDSLEYSMSLPGITWGRTDLGSSDFCLQNPSKNLVNNPCIDPTATPIHTTTPSQTSNAIIIPSTSLRISNSPQPVNSLTSNNHINNDSGQVLGTDINLTPTSSTNNTAQGLSFISFSYSLLTIVSVLIKMKVNV